MMPKLSVVCHTYNHKNFITQALDGFVMQKTNFAFEVLVHDDASTDGTTAIVLEYAKKYPEIIKPIVQTENQWRKGKTMSKTFIYPHIRGEYVAFCEGDDYWTDEHKLQRQVDFLDANPDYALCFHPVEIIWEGANRPSQIFPDVKKFGKFNLNSLLKENFIQTNTVVYRWRFKDNNFDRIPDRIMPGDWFLHLLHAELGKIGFLPEVMAVYRRHPGGVWTVSNQAQNWIIKNGQLRINFYENIEKHFKVSKKFDIELIKKTMYYAALPQDAKPPKARQQVYLLALKLLYSLTFGDCSKIFKARYKALKKYTQDFK